MGNQSQYGQNVRTAVPSRAPAKVDRDPLISSPLWYQDQKTLYKQDAFFDGCELRHAQLVNSINAIEKLRASPDPTLTSAAHSLKINAAVDQLAEKLNRQAVDNDMFALNGYELTQQAIKDKTSLIEDVRSAEVRTALRNMSPAQRRAAMSEALETKDKIVLGSVLHGSALLSGMTAKEQNGYKEHYLHLHARPERDLSKATKKAGSKLQEATETAMKHLQKLKVDVQAEEISSAEYAAKEFESALINLNP